MFDGSVCPHVFILYSNVGISVGPGLFVVKSGSMHELVDEDEMAIASVGKRDFLHPTPPTDIAPASGIRFRLFI